MLSSIGEKCKILLQLALGALFGWNRGDPALRYFSKNIASPDFA
jgi:hypothetical protein